MTLEELKALWGTPEALWDAWDRALESGRFEKGVAALRTAANKYCCLGVLNEIAGVQQHLRPKSDIWSQGSQLSFITPDVAQFLDITMSGDLLAEVQWVGAGPNGQTWTIGSLIGLNDRTTATFPDIARFIREQRAAGNFRPYKSNHAG